METNEKEVVVKRVSYGVTIDGQRYPVRKPNLKMLKNFTKKQRELENSDKKDEFALIDSSIEFLAGLGIPSEVAEELDPDMLEDVIKTVTGQKKS